MAPTVGSGDQGVANLLLATSRYAAARRATLAFALAPVPGQRRMARCLRERSLDKDRASKARLLYVVEDTGEALL